MYTFEVIFLKQFHRAEYVLYSVHTVQCAPLSAAPREGPGGDLTDSFLTLVVKNK